MTEPTCPQQDLDEAATALLSLARAAPFEVDAGLRLSCLWAAEQLRGQGARATDHADPTDPHETNAVITDALQMLESLPRDLRSELADTIVELRAAADRGG